MWAWSSSTLDLGAPFLVLGVVSWGIGVLRDKYEVGSARGASFAGAWLAAGRAGVPLCVWQVCTCVCVEIA